MTVAVIASEYNPFHNGHAHHIAETRAAGATHIVAVMSGNFTQRGIPACLDKFTRAEFALSCGADVVLQQYVNRETDRYNCQGTTSSTSLAVIFHVLQTALIEEMDFQNEQFKLVHPGGAVGERLAGKKSSDPLTI